MIDAAYLQILLSKYRDEPLRIYITDSSNRIIAANDEERIGSIGTTAEYILRVNHAAIIDSPADGMTGSEETVTYGTPILEDGEAAGALIVHAPGSRAAEVGTALQKAIEAATEFSIYENRLTSNPKNERYRIGRQLISGQFDREAVTDLMNRSELDPLLMRAVICIRLEYLRPSYFNINLNLGYQSSFEMLRQEVENKVRSNRALNSQDLVFFRDRATLVVIKSFRRTESSSTRLYLAMDRVCSDLAASLRHFSSFSFHIAYGNLYEDISRLHLSFKEAGDILDVGLRCSDAEVYSLNDLLFENVCLNLHPQIIHKRLLPILEKTISGASPDTSLIETAEAYVDSGLRLGESAERTGLHRNTISARIEKLRSLTGLDISKSFEDAFLLKMLAVYLRLSANAQPAPEQAVK